MIPSNQWLISKRKTAFRSEWALVDIGDIPIDHAQAIDLEVQRQGLRGLLPAPVLQVDSRQPG